MLNSGLLSLSIHEALTFDDTEIALSPDLFIDNIIHNTGSVSTVLTNGSRQVALGGRGVTGAQNGGATRSQSSKQHQSSDPSLTTASVATEQHAHHHESTTTIGSNVSHRKLDVGDMIEIKVWDPHNIRSSPPPSQILSQRKRPTPSSDDPASIPTVTPTQQFDQRKHSLPTSSDLRKNTPVEPTGGETSTVSSPTNPPKAPPPPPPHSNPISPGNNSENNHLDNTKPPRPPRRGGTPKATPRMVVNPTKPSRHFRDISDMTMDTDVGDLLAHASMDSHDLVLPSGEQLNHMSKISSTHTLRLSFVMMVGEKTLTSLKGNSRSQVSMLRQVADLYNLSPYDMVTVHKIDKEEEPHVLKQVSADFVTVTIKDQFISRGEMHFFQASLIGRWIYEGERLISLNKIKAHAREIRHKNRSAKSGIVTNDTKITFRSRSARFVWLVQLSCEMWDYASPASNSCELYFDKFVNFMYKLFRKWKELEVTHSLTVIFFSRTLILDPSSKKGPLKRDVYGRYYEDHFKTIIGNETTPDWHALVVRMKRAFVNYPIELGWKEGKRRPSTAMQGNVLEAINVALNLLQFHYLDRDLYRTGNSIVVVSPDCGVFEVDKGLAGITYQRMMDNGIGSDMLCLGLPPLHVAPFFLYNNDFHSIEKEGVDTNKVYYEIPHWSNLSFLAYDSEHGDEEVVENITSFDMEMRQIQIGPNGFLIPKAAKLKNETAPPASPAKTFCIIGNNKANPPPTAASQRQQRQLISGRDFKDILEACRPKNSTYSLPSPLLNLLKMSHNERQTGKKTEQEDEKEYSEPTRLTEWGTVDFQEISQIAPFILTQRRSRMSSGGGSSSLAGVDHADNRSDSSNNSTSSSFASQLTNFLGRSLDRSSIMGAGAMPMAMISNAKTGAYQIQRPPSLDLESDPCTNEQTVSPPKRGQSSESLSSIVLTEMVTERGDDGLEFNEENLRCLMNKHDRYYSKPTQLAAARQTADRSSPLVASDNQGKESPNAFDFAKQGESVNSMSGGLGAALLQYNVSSEKTPLHLGPSAAKRIFSSGKLSTLGTTPSAVFDGRPMSPYMSMVGLSIASDPPDMIKLPQPFLHHSTTLDPGILERPKMPVKSKLVMNRSSSSGLVDKPVEKKQQQILLYNSKSSLPIIKRQAPDSPSSLAKSPPRVATALTSQKVANQMKAKQQQPPPQRIRQKSSRKSSRRKGACNPFRQQDEDEELKRKSHNSRRWSHVFPLGEVEFKRRAGPNWKSLCQPAILPLTIDYFPSPQELEDKDEFQFQPYTLTLNGLESAYDSHKELLEEMVRQRVTQDYQVVPLQVLKESSLRGELAESTRGRNVRLGFLDEREQYLVKTVDASEDEEIVQFTLSMGHRIHVLTYDSLSDSIDVKIYTAKNQDDPHNKFEYHYHVYSPLTNTYCPESQSFKKYSQVYRWNKMDHCVLKDEMVPLTEMMRCRRIIFSLIPPKFDDEESEQQYLNKFQRLLEYLSKLRDKDECEEELGVVIQLKKDPRPESETRKWHGTIDKMKRFQVKLRRGKNDPIEWIEIAVDSVFDTQRSYRILISWLVATSSKVETQIHLLQRRCNQFGLNLTPVPQASISRDIFLNPISVPLMVCVRNVPGASKIPAALLELFDFCDDGRHMTEPTFLQCVDGAEQFHFPLNRLKKIRSVACRQFVHRATRAVFIRIIVDEKGWAIVVFIINYNVVEQSELQRNLSKNVVEEVRTFLDGLAEKPN